MRINGQERWHRVGYALRTGLLAALVPTAGCQLPPPEVSQTIHVADIINSIKCGLGEAVASDAGRRRLTGTTANVELNLKVADTRTFGAQSPAAGSLVIFGWGGPAVLPTLSASSQQAFTVDTKINLTYRLDGPNAVVCSAPGVNVTDRFGFARWLGDVLSGLSKVTPAGPRGTLDALSYEATFAATRAAQAGGTVQIVLINAGASGGQSRADTQRLKIVITPAAATPAGFGVAGRRGGADRIEPLSRSMPAAR